MNTRIVLRVKLFTPSNIRPSRRASDGRVGSAGSAARRVLQ